MIKKISSEIPSFYKKIIVTGGAGFIGGCLVRKLLNISHSRIFNIDKLGYASDLTSINNEIINLGENSHKRYKLINLDLSNKDLLVEAINQIKPDLVFHLAAESHVDRSIAGPEDFVSSNIIGTFNLLETLRSYYEKLSHETKQIFRLHHISTDEVFGSADKNKFSENTPYNPSSPYSATKASSDHLVKAWHTTYGLPVLISNCSNNYGPWQFPEKLIPLVIFKALKNESIPIYGDGKNVRDWLYVEDHVEALLNVAFNGSLGSSYCIGGCNEYTNLEVVKLICSNLDNKIPKKVSFENQICFVKDRLGHDYRYAIDNSTLINELGWHPKYSFKEGLKETINWYLNNIEWCESIITKKQIFN